VTSRPRADRLRNRAVIHVESIESQRDRLFAREVIVAYLDGRPAASWLVMCEPEWGAWSLNHLCGSGLGQGWPPGPSGLDPKTFAIALRSALKDVRVFAELHLAVTKWLKCIHEVAGEDLSFSVRDARELVRDYEDDKELWRRAAADASEHSPPTRRAASEAIRLAEFIRLLNAPPHSGAPCQAGQGNRNS
jgi:hypothetical protein